MKQQFEKHFEKKIHFEIVKKCMEAKMLFAENPKANLAFCYKIKDVLLKSKTKALFEGYSNALAPTIEFVNATILQMEKKIGDYKGSSGVDALLCGVDQNSMEAFREAVLMYLDNEIDKNEMEAIKHKVFGNIAGGNSKPAKKLYAKYYALYHWMLIAAGEVNPFGRNENDQNQKRVIQDYAKKNYPDISAEQFYREFKEIDYTNKNAIRNCFGAGFKEKIKSIDSRYSIAKELKNFPD